MLTLKQQHTLPLVGTLLGITLSTLAVWYYSRKLVDSQEPAKPAEAPNNSTFPAATPSADLPVSSQRNSGRTSTSLPQQSSATPIEYHSIVEMDRQNPTVIIMYMKKRDAADSSRNESVLPRLTLSGGPFTVNADINCNNGLDWSLVNLQHLGRAFAHLRSDLNKRKCLCTKLNVVLPKTNSFESNEGVDNFLLPGVQSLFWESHPYHLPLIGLRRNLGLTKLELRSHLSFRDCALLLQCASRTLQYCDIEVVIDNNGATFPFPQETHLELQSAGLTSMPRLKTLYIESMSCPGQMLSAFEFSALEDLQLKVDSGLVNPAKDLDYLPWSRLARVFMKCTFVSGGAAWVTEASPNAVQRTFDEQSVKDN